MDRAFDQDDAHQVDRRAAGARILVADEPGAARRELEEALRAAGHAVLALGQPEAAAWLEEPDPDLDLVLWAFDPRVPKQEALERALARPSAARGVILVSAGGWLKTAAAAARVRATAILRRPLDPQSLRCAVRAALVPVAA